MDVFLTAYSGPEEPLTRQPRSPRLACRDLTLQMNHLGRRAHFANLARAPSSVCPTMRQLENEASRDGRSGFRP